ncbi:HBL136Wp [Eremothecium sinecaudum]|uniref:Chitobiosyldiphosphodolichol beta-mannosyltransferase n=1 Tax=Eremothecium sinecaudum TaxID=45286 RepID=A0A120K0X6_9SACH|nr:HBL136Wp [Eremothecium sinecaudum]AMD18766.1 HBL136Wp [Eremothecium sinecaudum]
MLEDVPYWLWALFAVYLSTPVLVYWVVPYIWYHDKSRKKRIALCLLGDIGHSPRMCCHATSFSQQGWEVELCGYLEELPPTTILEDPGINIRKIPLWSDTYKERSFVINAVLKIWFQLWHLTKMFWQLRGCDYIMLQNPPSIPILPLAVIFKAITQSKLIIDWHNFGYSILQLRFRSFYHPVVFTSYMVEAAFGHAADYHFTVTSAMKDYVVAKMRFSKKRVSVLYDKPSDRFAPLPAEDRDAALQQDFVKGYIPEGFSISKGDVIFVTSTSFTPDEDLSVLIGALKLYEASAKKDHKTLPRILVFITGKGPMKDKYVQEVLEYEWQLCRIEFLWLKADDYPKLLQLCDYGVSLHTSSSGLDLPMKILDMFGSGLPVLAMQYPVLKELLQHNVNGWVFKTRQELYETLLIAVKHSKDKARLKDTVISEGKCRWDETWSKAMKVNKLIP